MGKIAEQYTSEVAIVLVGDFSPLIFQPAWFASQQLLRASEAENAKIEVIHSDITIFATDWLSLQVARNRLTVLTKSAAHTLYLKDLVVAILTKLPHTPVQQLGINVQKTLKFDNLKDFNNFGHMFTPKSAWPGFKNPGMLQVTMKSERVVQEDCPGYLTTTIAYESPLHAVIKFNDHYEGDGYSSAADFAPVMARRCDDVLKECDNAIVDISKHFASQEKFDAGTN